MGDETVTPGFFRLTSFHDEWILARTSSDTIYTYLPGGDMILLLVRTLSINSMNAGVFLFPTAITGRYYLMRTLNKEFDFEKMRGFSTADLMCDK